MRSSSLLKLFVLTAMVVGAAVFVRHNWSLFSQMRLYDPWVLLVLVAVCIAVYFSIGVVTAALLRAFGVVLSMHESFALALVTGFYNLITPLRGGMAVRGMYLKEKHNLPYTDFVATVAASHILSFLVSSFVGLMSLFFLSRASGVSNWLMAAVLGCVFVPLLGIVLVSPHFREPRHRWLGKIVRVINGWHTMKSDRRAVFVITLVSIAQVLLTAFMLQLQFYAIGGSISFMQAVFLSALASLSLLIAITPAGLGITEAVTVFSALAIGIAAPVSLSAALLGRLASVLVLFTLGPFYSYTLLKKQSAPLRNSYSERT